MADTIHRRLTDAATRVWRPRFPDIETLFRESHDTIRRAWEAA